MGPPARPRPRELGPLLGLAALTLLPVVGAFVLYLHPDWAPEGRVHHGVLVEPPQQLADPLLTTLAGEPFSTRAWQGRWTLLRVIADCGPDCRTDIDTLIRIHRLLGANQERLQDAVALFATATAPTLRRVMEDFPGTLALHADGAVGADGPFATGPGLYVLDPEVRVILRYPPGFDPFGVLEDLKRLLKYSWLG
ncbi:MAG: SCO family protein [Gammaproteobacteria bacterium]